MNFDLVSFASGSIQKHAVHEVMKCNEYTEPFGLSLTQAQAVALVETRSHALRSNGRIEFGGGIIDKLTRAFCDSPYISMQNYAQTLHDLTEMFYYYKNETMDMMTDDELIQFMKTAFDGICQGSLELLAERELYQMAQNLGFGGAGECEIAEEGDEDEQ